MESACRLGGRAAAANGGTTAVGNTENEKNLCGDTWDTVHGGHFGDPAIALPPVEAVLDAAPVPLASAELEGRYSIGREEMMETGAAMRMRRGGRLPEAYHASRHGFTACLTWS